MKISENIMNTNELIDRETEYLRTLLKQNVSIKLSLKTNAILKLYPKLEVFHTKIQNDIA